MGLIETHSAANLKLDGELIESPKYIQTSLAAAMTLGFKRGKFFRNARLYCVNLLLTYKEGCFGRCAYCGLSRARRLKVFKNKSFIRVNWPVYGLPDIIKALNMPTCKHVERVCVSMVTNRRASEDLITVVQRIKDGTNLEISALIAPTIVDKSWLIRLKETGCGMVGIAIDAATRKLFDRTRGMGISGPHRWDRYWECLHEAVEIFGISKVGVHLIAGLGETEKEMVHTIQRCKDIGGETHLFSFFPEKLSPMENCEQPPIGQYRRIQLAQFLINKQLSKANNMQFNDSEQIIDLGLDDATLNKVISTGKPFVTSGCPGKTMENACNRPYANETPYQAYCGELRNFPFNPEPEDIQIIRTQIWDYNNNKMPEDML